MIARDLRRRPAPRRLLAAALLLAPSLAAGAQGVVPATALPGNAIPGYPAAALGSAVAGEVIFIAQVTPEGTVSSVRITQVPRAGVGFEAAVTDAVGQWRFQPATNDGVPIATSYVGKIGFAPQWATLHARMYSRPSAAVWQVVQAVVERLGRMEQPLAAESQVLVTQWSRFDAVGVAPPDPEADGGVPDEFQLHVFVSPFMEPAQVHVGSVSLGPGVISYNSGPPEAWFFRLLEERLAEQGQPIPLPANAHRTAAARLGGIEDRCLTAAPPSVAPSVGPRLLLAVPALHADLPPGTDTVVTLEVSVALDGAVAGSRLLGAAGGDLAPGMAAAAAGAVSLWRYVPSRRAGCALPFTGQVSLSFRGADESPSAFSGQIYEPGPEVETPRVVDMVQPTYTPEALRREIEGGVLVEAVVLPDGTVGNVGVVRSLDATFGLDQRAVEAARQWRFEPGTRDGVPVAVRVTIELTFALGR